MISKTGETGMAVNKYKDVSFLKLEEGDREGIAEMSRLATAIVRDYYDPILGTAQNDYMLALFQSESAIKNQLEHGAEYRFIEADGKNIGFMAFYPKEDFLYLSKFYIEASFRGKGAGGKALFYLGDFAGKLGLRSIRLNVNKHNYDSIGFYESKGFVKIRDEVNDIGNGFVMDDYVYELKVHA